MSDFTLKKGPLCADFTLKKVQFFQIVRVELCLLIHIPDLDQFKGGQCPPCPPYKKNPALYNSVPYDTNHMKLIEREIMSRVQKCNDESYNITVPDVMNAVTHLKDGKSDGYEGL